MRSGMRRAAAAFAILAVAGCYTVGVKAPPGVVRIYVPFVKNSTFPYERDIEYDMTRELRAQIEVQSACIPVTSEAEADAVLRVGIENYRQTSVAEDNRDRAVYAHAVIDVRVDFRRTGPDGDVFYCDTISDRSSFPTDTGFAAARQNVVRRVVDRILATALNSWDE